MVNKRKPTTDTSKEAAEPTERNKEVHVCCYDEGGFYFAADLSGFIITPFHEVGELCAWLLNYDHEIILDGRAGIVVHAHKPQVMRPHPVLEDLD